MSLTPDSVGAFDVMDVLRRTIQAALPGVKKAHYDSLDRANLPALSFRIVQYLSPAIDAKRVYRTLDIDVIYLSKDNTVEEALPVMDKLAEILPFGLPVKDRFIHMQQGPEMHFVDQDLHMLFTYGWHDLARPVVITESGNLGEVDEGETSTGNIIDENDPTIAPVPEVDDEGNPVTDEGFVKANYEYMENLIIEMEE